MARRLRGLVALLVIVVLLVGIPLGLYAAAGAPWPHSLPSGAAVRNALTAPDNGEAFLAVLKVLGWLAWLSFAVMLLLEIAARASGVRVPRIPALGIQQRTAAGLVTAAALLFTVAAPVALAAPAGAAIDTTHTRAPSISQVVGHESVSQEATQQAPQERAQTQQAPEVATPQLNVAVHEYHVEPGDSLFSIAEKTLGNGDRFKEIAALNYGVLQADGAALTPSHWLVPGWTLKVPVDQEAQHQVEHVTVKPGDTLSQIAQDTLGDASRYGEIAQATRHVDQPGGEHLTDPDLIKPGWTVDVPVAHAAEPTREAPQPAHRQPAAPDHGDNHGNDHGDNKGGGPDAPLQVVLHHQEGGGAGSSSSEATAAALAGAGNGLSTGALGGLSGFLAAGLLGAVGVQTMRRRRLALAAGEPVPATEPIEEQLAAVADEPAVVQVDRALRSLAHACERESRRLPVVRAARLVHGRLELFLDGAAVLPTPWEGASGATVWSGRMDSAEFLDAGAAAEVPAPFPSLVTVGRDHEGGHIFVDLAHVHALGVVGAGTVVRGVLAAIAAELGTLPWAGDVRVTVVGAFRDLAEHLGAGRLRYLPSAEMVLAELANRSVPAAREVILLAAEATSDQRERLAQAVEATPGVALVAASTDGVVGRWAMHIEPGGMAMLQPLGLPMIPQELDGPTYDEVLAVLSTAQAPTMMRPVR